MEGTALPVSGVPQSSQNLEVGLLSAAHFGQRRDSALPHSAQNLFALVLSVPHFEQRIGVRSTETNVPRLVSRLRFKRHLAEGAREVPVQVRGRFLQIQRLVPLKGCALSESVPASLASSYSALPAGGVTRMFISLYGEPQLRSRRAGVGFSPDKGSATQRCVTRA